MIRRLATPRPLRTMGATGLPTHIYGRDWHRVTRVIDQWVQRSLWWEDENTNAAEADRLYARLVLDNQLVWDVYQDNGVWYLERIVMS